MSRVIASFVFVVIALAISSCSTSRSDRGAVSRQSSEFASDGKAMIKEGDTLVKDGIAKQNQAKELRVLASENRRQADYVSSQGDDGTANQLRLEAIRQESEAMALENQGRETEARGRTLIERGERSINRGEWLDKESTQIKRQ